MKALTQAIVDASEIEAANKQELLELLQTLSVEIVGAKKKSVMKALLQAIEERAKGAAAVVQIATSLGLSIGQLFGP